MPPKKVGLYDKLFQAVNVDREKMSVKLTQAPPVVNKSTFKVFQAGTVWQADLIYMPEDNGYNFILTVVDVASRAVDGEPLKGRTSQHVIEGFEQIFKRKYLSKGVKYLYTDPGSEFKNEAFRSFMEDENGIIVRHTMTARKNQMGIVEYYNHIFTKVLGTRMTSEELDTGIENKNWVTALPRIIEVLNSSEEKK